jgi:hypothetical protein
VKCRLFVALSCAACLLIGTGTRAAAGALEALSSRDATAGLKSALAQSAAKAVQQLGATGGFLKDARVTIPLPAAFRKVDSALRMLGLGGDADALKADLNHAAEEAVSSALPVLKKSLRSMTLANAKDIVAGGEDSATNYFRGAAGDELRAAFKPIVAGVTAKNRIASLYDQYAGQAKQYGLLSGNEANMNDYVTEKALDGIFIVIADEEHAIRRDPLGQASAIIRKVFGAQ